MKSFLKIFYGVVSEGVRGPALIGIILLGDNLPKKVLIKKKNYYYERYYAKLRKMTLVRNRIIISIVGEKYRK